MLHLQDGYSIPSGCIPNKELCDLHNNICVTSYTTHDMEEAQSQWIIQVEALFYSLLTAAILRIQFSSENQSVDTTLPI